VMLELMNFWCRLKELTARPAATEHARRYLIELQQVPFSFLFFSFLFFSSSSFFFFFFFFFSNEASKTFSSLTYPRACLLSWSRSHKPTTWINPGLPKNLLNASRKSLTLDSAMKNHEFEEPLDQSLDFRYVR
jgi:hypothetical protein